MRKFLFRIENEKLNSLIVALLLMTPAIITLLNSILLIDVAISSAVLSLLISLLLLFSIISAGKVKCNLPSLLFLLTLLAIFIVTTTFREDLNYSVFQLSFYVIIPVIVCQQKFSLRDVLIYSLLLSIPLVFGIEKMLTLTNVGLNQANMYNVYCFIPPIVAALVYLVFYREKNIVVNLAAVLNLFYLVRVALSATRGFWLVLAVFLFLLVYYRLQKKQSKKRYYLILLFTILILLVLYINIDNIVYSVLSIAENVFGDDVGIVIKTRRLLEQGDLLNGRQLLWGESLRHILSNPVFGHGFESMKYLSDGLYQYPHNFILQLFLDCGILGLYPICIAFKTVIVFFDDAWNNENVKIALLYFLSISIPIVSLSYDVWKYPAFWLLIGYGISIIRRKNVNKD